ncbi:hypothetical protein BGZ92_010252 [Podila epicladia]|nr:hypothetical protein BGZ92_010252 [Podila epicladia]
MTSSVHEPAQQWNQFEPTSYQPAAHALARTSRHTEYDDNDDQDRDASSSDGYLSSSSSSSSGNSLASSSSLSPGQSDEEEDEDEDMESDESSEDDEDDSDNQDSQENEAPKSRGHRNHHHHHHRHHHHNHHDYYGGGRGHGQHGGLLPIAPAPAIPPSSDRDALEQEARQRRLERDSAKRRQSLTNQAAPDASTVDLTASSKNPLVMEMIRYEAERERADRDYDGDNSSNDIEDDEEDDDEDEDGNKDMDEDETEEDSESDESEESESSSSGSSDEENDSEMNGSVELEDMAMSEHVPGCQEEGDLRLPPQGSIFGGDDMAQDYGHRNNSESLGTGGAFDLVSSTHDHYPLLHDDHVLQKMEVDYGPSYPHPSEQSNNVQLYNTPPPTIWDSPATFAQGFQLSIDAVQF